MRDDLVTLLFEGRILFSPTPLLSSHSLFTVCIADIKFIILRKEINRTRLGVKGCLNVVCGS